MARYPYRPKALRGKYFLARDVLERGVLTRHQLESDPWRRLFQGVYVDSSVTVTHRLRCAAAVSYVIPRTAVIAGRSAAVLHGAGLAEPLDPVEALAPRGSEVIPHQGVVVHRAMFTADEVMTVGGITVTTPVRTCWDLARWLSPIEAVVLIDRMLANRRVTLEQLTAYRDQQGSERPRPRGWRRYAAALSLVDGRAESPQESRLRVRLIQAGLPRPQSQYIVRTASGEFIARVDLAWDECRVAMEYDGLWHGESRRQIHRDRERLNALQLAGWTVLHVTAERLREEFDGIVRDIRAALRRPSRRT